MPACTDARTRPLDQPPAAVPGSRRVLEGQPQVVRQRVEARAPEGELLVAAARAGLPEPVHVVVVLRGGGWVGQPARVGLRHFLPQEGQRPLVGQDVVQDEQQDGRVPGRLLDDLHAGSAAPARDRRGGGPRGWPPPVPGHPPPRSARWPATARRGPPGARCRHPPRTSIAAAGVAPPPARTPAQAAAGRGGRGRGTRCTGCRRASPGPTGARTRGRAASRPVGPVHRRAGPPGRARAGARRPSSLDGPLKPVGAVVHLLGADHRERSRRRSRFRVNV